MTIPLVDNNGKDSINTSVIAIKKEIEQIESLLQNARNKLKSLSDNDFLYRSDLTDTVTVGDNQPVTSNAVADKINSLDVPSVGGSGKYISEISETDGKICATATDLGNMEPVDAVTSGDMHSVTSNAVYDEFSGYLASIVKWVDYNVITTSNGNAETSLNIHRPIVGVKDLDTNDSKICTMFKASSNSNHWYVHCTLASGANYSGNTTIRVYYLDIILAD